MYFNADQTADEIQQRLDRAQSTLTAFFRYNAEHADGRNYLYQQFPTHYVFHNKEREWRPRKQGTVIGRMYYYSPTAGERFYLRLLLTVVRGPTSFEHLRTVAGTLHPTFQSACIALGLLEDDCKWINCFTEASIFAGGPQLRSLFASALVYGPVADPPALWERFAPNICDDLPRLLAQRDDVPDQDNIHLDYGLFLLQRILADHGKSLTDYSLPLFQHA